MGKNRYAFSEVRRWSIDEIHYKGWRVQVLHSDQGWKALLYRPSSPLHETNVPEGPDRRIVIENAQLLIDEAQK